MRESASATTAAMRGGSEKRTLAHGAHTTLMSKDAEVRAGFDVGKLCALAKHVSRTHIVHCARGGGHVDFGDQLGALLGGVMQTRQGVSERADYRFFQGRKVLLVAVYGGD